MPSKSRNMNAIIIEDEVKAFKALGQLITSIRPDIQILAYIQSNADAINYLKENDPPDVIFMDIHLSDGLCFEIFKNVKIKSPVIFCTAYDNYAIEAFKSNGIDYVLKPFSRESIAQSMKKIAELKNFFQRNKKDLPDLEYLLTLSGQQTGKRSFLLFKNNKYVTIQTDNIAYFCIKKEMTSIMTFEKKEYPFASSLEDINKLLSPTLFYRINRQYLVNFNAIKEVEHYFARKLLVKLSVPTDDKLVVAKDKSTHFLNWMECR